MNTKKIYANNRSHAKVEYYKPVGMPDIEQFEAKYCTYSENYGLDVDYSDIFYDEVFYHNNDSNNNNINDYDTFGVIDNANYVCSP